MIQPPLPLHPAGIAEAVQDVLDDAVARHGQATLAIPGGRSPGAVLTALASMLDAHVRDHVHLFWVDERAVPRNDALRNDAATLSAWSAGGALPAHVHQMPAEREDLEAAASDYAQTLKAVCGERSIDVCLLGIGEDGHVASLFPEHPGLDELSPVFAVYDSPKNPPRRLTMSLTVLNCCRHCFVLAGGAAKGAVYAALRKNGAQKRYPISLLKPEHCVWYLDEAALSAAVD